jgi:hypothetical protein
MDECLNFIGSILSIYTPSLDHFRVIVGINESLERGASRLDVLYAYI